MSFFTYGDKTDWQRIPLSDDRLRADGGTTELEYGDPVVPKSVRRGGATGPMLKRDLAGNGTALEGNAMNYVCQECGTVRRFVTSEFTTSYYCDECEDVRWFEFRWDLNCARGAWETERGESDR